MSRYIQKGGRILEIHREILLLKLPSTRPVTLTTASKWCPIVQRYAAAAAASKRVEVSKRSNGWSQRRQLNMVRVLVACFPPLSHRLIGSPFYREI